MKSMYLPKISRKHRTSYLKSTSENCNKLLEQKFTQTAPSIVWCSQTVDKPFES